MRPNISNCHALPGTLIIFEGPDGSGKTTEIKILKKLLESEWHKVCVSEWKSAPIIGDFLKANESLQKIDERILPETSLFFQAADLLYRIEREIIPALKKNHIVIMDRGMETLIVRGVMIGIGIDQVKQWLLWWRNTIYKELFDKAITIGLTVGLEESLKRLQKRALKENGSLTKNGKRAEWTLLALDFINNLVYSPEGKKMTRNDKKDFVRKTQWSIIDTYKSVFEVKTSRVISINGEGNMKMIEKDLQRKVVDTII